MSTENEKPIDQEFAESTPIIIPAECWEDFCKWLNAPPRELPRLKRLLQEPSVFNGEDKSGNNQAGLHQNQ